MDLQAIIETANFDEKTEMILLALVQEIESLKAKIVELENRIPQPV
ncbi:MAG: hypothetical protein SAK29_31680 [Scytonema sp. PMC 1069.18]|nr:hypothetical protein [Scytonema sp. PMC 1069.18]MEC4888290.1 hypothetical protein [Scytonema sp. PMC 1070.18]